MIVLSQNPVHIGVIACLNALTDESIIFTTKLCQPGLFMGLYIFLQIILPVYSAPTNIRFYANNPGTFNTLNKRAPNKKCKLSTVFI
jgi:hypothetical protein